MYRNHSLAVCIIGREQFWMSHIVRMLSQKKLTILHSGRVIYRFFYYMEVIAYAKMVAGESL